MKKTLIFLTIILLTASAFADITLHSRHRTHSGTYNFDSRFVLYEQLANVSVESGIIAQDFETAYDAMDAEGADEFEVPEGEIWTINEVVVLGSYSTAGPCELANVRFYEDAPGMPGTLLYEYLDVPANPDVDGNLDCFIPDTPFTEGTYWVSVQGRLDAGTCGLWFWIKQAAPTIGYEFHWQNPLDGFATGYTTWTTGSITHAGYIDYNLSFCLYGTVAGATPAAPTDVVVTPDAGGAVSVDIDWICPTLQVNGNPLTELLEMRVYRGVDIIYTDTSPVIGGPGNYTDAAVPAPGLYSFKVVGYNSSGEGIPIVETVYVGEDVPNVVENLLLERTSTSVLSGTLTWVNPVTGLNNGVFNEPILGYHIVRSDGATFELTGIATEYIDNTIPVAGNYFYTVQAYNSIGDGGTETSNTVLIADAGLLIMENFDDGVIPAGWLIIGLGAENWIIQSSNNASGTAPEARFGWAPPFIGVSRLVTMPVNTEGMAEVTLEFKHFLDHYSGVGGGPYTLSVTTTSDGVTWNTTPFSIVNPSSNIGPETQIITIANPDVGSSTFQLAFKFDGDTFNIDYWYIDDVMLTVGSIPLAPPTNLFVNELGYATWDVPVSRDLLGYNVYLDGTYVEFTTDLFYQYNGLVNGTTYLSEVTAVYDESESDPIEYTFVYNPTLNPPQNLFVDDLGYATWETPIDDRIARTDIKTEMKAITNDDTRDFIGYNVYLDDGYVEFTTDLFYQFNGLVNGTAYIAGVSAVYDEGESEIIDFEFTFVLDPPQNLFVTELGYATWETPIDDRIARTDIKTEMKAITNDDTRDFIGYNVYLDGGYVEFTTDLFYQYNGLINGTTYLSEVTAVYDEGESEIIELEFTFVLDPPQSLDVICIEDHAHFTWEAPVANLNSGNRKTKANAEATRDLTGYSVYLNQVEVATNIPDLEYDFYDLIYGNYYDAGVKVIYDEGASELIEINFQYTGTGVENILPLSTELTGNYPNPFNPITIINYSLAEKGNVELIVFNIKGQNVKTLINERLTAGNHQVVWDGKDENNKPVSSGIYFYKMNTDKFTSTKKMILMK